MSISVKWALDGKPVWSGSFSDRDEFESALKVFKKPSVFGSNVFVIEVFENA